MPEDELAYKRAGILYQAINIDSNYGKKVLVFSKMRYDIDDFLRDLVILLVII